MSNAPDVTASTNISSALGVLEETLQGLVEDITRLDENLSVVSIGCDIKNCDASNDADKPKIMSDMARRVFTSVSCVVDLRMRIQGMISHLDV